MQSINIQCEFLCKIAFDCINVPRILIEVNIAFQRREQICRTVRRLLNITDFMSHISAKNQIISIQCFVRIIDYMIVVANYNLDGEVKVCALHLVQEKSVFSAGKYLIAKDLHGFGINFFTVK